MDFEGIAATRELWNLVKMLLHVVLNSKVCSLRQLHVAASNSLWL